MNFNLSRTLLSLVLVALFSMAASAHTYHTTLTRMDFNAKDKNIEISIQVFIHDAMPLLERRLGKRVDIAKTPEVDAQLQKYLEETFVFQNKAGETQKFKWVGKEFENDVVHLFLEIPFDGEFAGTKLRNTMFFESFEEQTNHVIANYGETKKSLMYKVGDVFKEL